MYKITPRILVAFVSVLLVPISVGAITIPDASLIRSQIQAKVDSQLRGQGISTAGLFRTDEVVVKFKGQETFVRLAVPAGNTVAGILEQLRSRLDVAYAEPNYIAHAFSVPNDPYYSLQWNLDNNVYGGIGWEEAREIETGAGVIVAVIDTGVAYETYSKLNWPFAAKNYYQAPDLVGTTFVAGYDFVEDDTHPNDDNGHGTHVTGTIAQNTGNSLGAAGVAPGAAIMPIKVLASNGSGTYADVAEGIRWAADHGAKVINLSLGGSTGASYLEEALAYAYNKGVTIVAAAGNNGTGSISYPAAYNAYVIAVGATRYNQTKAPYSNYGSGLDLVAPGGDIAVDQNSDGYGDGILQQTFSGALNNWGYYFYQGTSMATPHVAGVAALVIAHGNAVTPADVRTVLQNTARDLGTPGLDTTYGYGIVDAFAALGGALPPPPPPPPPPVALPIISSFTANPSTIAMGSTTQLLWSTTGASSTSINQGIGTVTGNSIQVSPTQTIQYVLTAINPGGSVTATTTVTVTQPLPPPPPPPPPGPTTVFTDSFESGISSWTQDAQMDWFSSTQRASQGIRSAEVDGLANNAALTSISINLASYTQATITFSWYIESGLDFGEYLAVDVSTNGGTTWTERARLRGNQDPENSWRNVTISVGSGNLKLRFRGTMSDSTEDAMIDNVRVVAQ